MNDIHVYVLLLLMHHYKKNPINATYRRGENKRHAHDWGSQRAPNQRDQEDCEEAKFQTSPGNNHTHWAAVVLRLRIENDGV